LIIYSNSIHACNCYYSCVFAFNKNYQEITTFGGKGGPGYDKISGAGSDLMSKYRVYTLDFIFKKIIDYGEELAEARIR
jgi:hypothetical protein